MVKHIVIVTCPAENCASQNVIRFGKNATGKQRYRCLDCKRTFVEKPHASRLNDPAFVTSVLAAYHERASLRGVARVFKVSRNTLADLLKKSQEPA